MQSALLPAFEGSIPWTPAVALGCAGFHDPAPVAGGPSAAMVNGLALATRNTDDFHHPR
jgi:hypothetical protein